MLEATLLVPETGVRGHMTSSEAAHIAQAAGVDRLVLTHMSDELPREELLAEAQAIHPSSVLCTPGDEYLF